MNLQLLTFSSKNWGDLFVQNNKITRGPMLTTPSFSAAYFLTLFDIVFFLQPSTFDVAQVFAAVDCFRSLKTVYSQLQVIMGYAGRITGIFKEHTLCSACMPSLYFIEPILLDLIRDEKNYFSLVSS